MAMPSPPGDDPGLSNSRVATPHPDTPAPSVETRLDEDNPASSDQTRADQNDEVQAPSAVSYQDTADSSSEKTDDILAQPVSRGDNGPVPPDSLQSTQAVAHGSGITQARDAEGIDLDTEDKAANQELSAPSQDDSVENQLAVTPSRSGPDMEIDGEHAPNTDGHETEEPPPANDYEGQSMFVDDEEDGTQPPDTEDNTPQQGLGAEGQDNRVENQQTVTSSHSSPDMEVDAQHLPSGDTHATQKPATSEYEDQSMFIDDDDEEHGADEEDELCEIDANIVSKETREKWNNHTSAATPSGSAGDPGFEITRWRVKEEDDDKDFANDAPSVNAGDLGFEITGWRVKEEDDDHKNSFHHIPRSRAGSAPPDTTGYQGFEITGWKVKKEEDSDNNSIPDILRSDSSGGLHDRDLSSPSGTRNKGKNRASSIETTNTILGVADQPMVNQGSSDSANAALDLANERIALLEARLAQAEGRLKASGPAADGDPGSSRSGPSRHHGQLNEQDGTEGDSIQIENDPDAAESSTASRSGKAASAKGRAQPQKRAAIQPLKKTRPPKRPRTKMGFGNNLKSNRRKKNSDFTGEKMLEHLRPEDPFQRRQVGNIHNFEASTIKEQIDKIKDQLRGDPNADLTRVNREISDLATTRSYLGQNRCKAMNGKWKLAGIETPLYHYQLWGLGWMLEREKDDEKIPGGILADGVGLGKTLEALSLIVADLHIAKDANERHKVAPSLVVVPSNLLWQWENEVVRHCPKVAWITYKERDNPQMNSLGRMDIVFITYHELLRNYPHPDAIKQLDELNLPPKDRRQKFNEAAGLVYHCLWRRVVFDEAHAMKNVKAITSKACLELGDRAKYRWALTGTPIPNGIKELVPYMKLINAPCPRALKCYNTKDIQNCNRLEHQKALDELAPLVAKTILKRNVMTPFLGRALFDIPQAHSLPNRWISFSKEEIHIYRRIEDYFRKAINAHSKTSTLRGRIPSYLAWALRLRQVTAHPFLLESLMKQYLTIDDIKTLRRELRAIGAETRLLDHIDWRRNEGANGNRFNMDPQLELIEKEKEAMCKLCQDLPMNPMETNCGHVFCADCLKGHLDTEEDEGMESFSCPACEDTITEYEPTELPPALAQRAFGRGANVQRAASSSSSSAGGASSGGRRRHHHGGRQRQDIMGTRGPGDDLNGLQPMSDVPSSFVTMCDEDPTLVLERSAKTTVVRDVILETLREHPDDKLIVFTQWTTVGKILGRILDAEKIGYYYLFGCFSNDDKKRNIKHFHDNLEAKVLIAGLKCGGQGLNLTCANRVINIDLWWNHAVEQQAFGRVYRIGQSKETYFYRIMVKNSIDGRLLKLQEQKLEQINAALKDYDPAKQRLSESDVAGLFGQIRRTANGQLVVERDYEDDDDEDEEEIEDEDEVSMNEDDGESVLGAYDSDGLSD